MANRYYNQFQYTAERAPVTLYATLQAGAAGAVAAVKGYGISSIVKDAGVDGKYEIVLSDKFVRCIGVDFKVVHSAISAVTIVQVLQSPADLQTAVGAGTKIIVQCIDKTGAAVNPESGAQVFIQLVLVNSTVDQGKGV